MIMTWGGEVGNPLYSKLRVSSILLHLGPGTHLCALGRRGPEKVKGEENQYARGDSIQASICLIV